MKCCQQGRCKKDEKRGRATVKLKSYEWESNKRPKYEWSAGDPKSRNGGMVEWWSGGMAENDPKS